MGSITQTEISHFNPLPPHGGRLQNCFQLFTFSLISIHSLHTEGDTGQAVTLKIRTEFQSTPSTRRETTQKLIDKLNRMLFQSTPSTRRETGGKVPKLRRFHISIHSLHTEGDWLLWSCLPQTDGFQSTPSTRRETRGVLVDFCVLVAFQSTPSTRRETSRTAFVDVFTLEFQSTPSTRRETLSLIRGMLLAENFNPLPPHGGRLGLFHTRLQNSLYFNPLPPHGGRLVVFKTFY